MLPHLSMVIAIVLWSTIYVAGKTAVTLIPLAETIATELNVTPDSEPGTALTE